MSWFLLGLSSFKADIEKWAQPGPAAGRSLFLSIFFLNLSRPAQLPPPLLLSLLCRAPKPSFSLLLLTYFKWKQEEGKLWKMVCACKTLHNSSNFNGFICWLWLIRFAPFLFSLYNSCMCQMLQKTDPLYWISRPQFPDHGRMKTKFCIFRHLYFCR